MSSSMTEPMPLADLMTSQQVANKLAVSVRTLWRLVEKGQVPPPIRYNRKLVRWKTTDVARYLDTLA